MKIKSQYIDTLLAERGLSRRAFSVICGISAQNISTIIRRGSCNPATAAKLAKGLHVSVADIAKED